MFVPVDHFFRQQANAFCKNTMVFYEPLSRLIGEEVQCHLDKIQQPMEPGEFPSRCCGIFLKLNHYIRSITIYGIQSVMYVYI